MQVPSHPAFGLLPEAHQPKLAEVDRETTEVSLGEGCRVFRRGARLRLPGAQRRRRDDYPDTKPGNGAIPGYRLSGLCPGPSRAGVICHRAVQRWLWQELLCRRWWRPSWLHRRLGKQRNQYWSTVQWIYRWSWSELE